MTSTNAPPAGNRWLFGPLPDLALGCGLVYVAVFAFQSVAGPTLRSWMPLELMPLVALAFAVPHYGATLLRVYGRRETRRAYAFFSVWITLALVGAFVWGLHVAVVGSWIVTVYLTWSPWHYAGQNYGVALLFLRRRGVTVSPWTKRLFHASFCLSYAMTFLALHGPDRGPTYSPDALIGSRYVFNPLGISESLRDLLLIGVGVVYAGVTAGALWRLRRAASWRDLGPSIAVVATQALWFSVPVLARNRAWLGGLEPLGEMHAGYTFLWVAMGHSLQYLWITSYFARKSGAAKSNLGFFTKALAAGALIWTVPAYLFAPAPLGGIPYDAGLGFMIASIVNLHHFVLDGAIWKLRDGRVARFLIRRRGGLQEAAEGADGRPWVRKAVLACGLGCAVVTAWAAIEMWNGYHQALVRGDRAGATRPVWQEARERMLRAAERLPFLGQEKHDVHLQVAVRDLRSGDLDRAEAVARRGIERYPTAWLWTTVARVYDAREDWEAAAAAHESAVEVDPENGPAHYYWAIHEVLRGRLAKARRRLQSARRFVPNSRLLDDESRHRMLGEIDRNLKQLAQMR